MLYIFNTNVNFLFIKKIFNINIDIVFLKKNYIFIKNDLKFTNIYNQLFFSKFIIKL